MCVWARERERERERERGREGGREERKKTEVTYGLSACVETPQATVFLVKSGNSKIWSVTTPEFRTGPGQREKDWEEKKGF